MPCTERWETYATIPQEYFPPQVTHFNAYTIHGDTWGAMVQWSRLIFLSKLMVIFFQNPNKVYEALYPADPANVTNPDFHRLEFFQPINFTDASFVQSPNISELWEQALGDQLYEFT